MIFAANVTGEKSTAMVTENSPENPDNSDCSTMIKQYREGETCFCSRWPMFKMVGMHNFSSVTLKKSYATCSGRDTQTSFTG